MSELTKGKVARNSPISEAAMERLTDWVTQAQKYLVEKLGCELDDLFLYSEVVSATRMHLLFTYNVCQTVSDSMVLTLDYGHGEWRIYESEGHFELGMTMLVMSLKLVPSRSLNRPFWKDVPTIQ